MINVENLLRFECEERACMFFIFKPPEVALAQKLVKASVAKTFFFAVILNDKVVKDPVIFFIRLAKENTQVYFRFLASIAFHVKHCKKKSLAVLRGDSSNQTFFVIAGGGYGIPIKVNGLRTNSTIYCCSL